MKNAADAFREEANRQRLTTGSRELDALIDGIRQGEFHLFYGDDEEALDLLIHRVLVNCTLPTERGGFAAKALYLNLCNYHKGKTILDRDRLSLLSKHVGVEPSVASESILSVSFDEAEQLRATQEVSRLLGQNRDIGLLVVNNLVGSIETLRKPLEARQILKQVVGMLKESATRNGLTVIVISSALKGSKSRIPKPEGSALLFHEANIIVFLRRVDVDGIHAIRACLVKHPYKECLHSTTVYVSRGGIDLVGRITPHLNNSIMNRWKN